MFEEVEAFNVFDHPQFLGRGGGEWQRDDAAGRGDIVNAMPPRQVQLAVKFNF